MKLIKFFFWLCLIFVIAYLMTDLKIGGKTIKQKIDQVIAGTPVGDYKDKAIRWIAFQLGEKQAEGENQLSPSQEDISEKDAKNLKKLIEKNN